MSRQSVQPWRERRSLMLLLHIQGQGTKSMWLNQEKSLLNTNHLSHKIVSLVSGEESPVTILRDTGASQSLILADAFPFSINSTTGNRVLLQGVELGTMNVLLHKIILKCNLVNGPVVVGVRPSLPVQGITVLLGNDLAGGRVRSREPSSVIQATDEVEQIPELFSPAL